MSIEEQTLKNTQDIGALTHTVSKLATMFEYSEKSRVEERADVKQVVAELKTLNDKISGMASMQKEISDLSGSVRALNHDLRNVTNTLQSLPLIKEKLNDIEKLAENHETRLNTIENWKTRAEASAGTIKLIIHSIWAFIAVGGLGVITWLTNFYRHGGGVGGE